MAISSLQTAHQTLPAEQVQSSAAPRELELSAEELAALEVQGEEVAQTQND